jgi:hypothetical protein
MDEGWGCIYLVQDAIRRLAYVNTVMNIRDGVLEYEYIPRTEKCWSIRQNGGRFASM